MKARCIACCVVAAAVCGVVLAMEEAKLRLRSVDGKTLSAADLHAASVDVQPDFDLRYAAYRDLVARKLVVKTGFKYGTHFRVYLGGVKEAHAPYLVHCLAEGREVPWAEAAGFVRLAHGVKKEMLFASGGSYLRLLRTKP